MSDGEGFQAVINEFDGFEREKYYPFDKAKGLIQYYNSSGGEEGGSEAKQAIWELNLLNLAFSADPENDIPDRWSWCEEHVFQPLPFWEEEACAYFEDRVKTCKNNLHLARYYYYLWVFKREYKNILQSGSLFQKTGQLYVEQGWYKDSFQLTPFLFRFSALIWRKLNDKDKPSSVAIIIFLFNR